MTRGLCTNLPSVCSKAAAKEQIEISEPNARCPECGSTLLPVQSSGNRRQALGLISGLAVLLGAAGTGAWWIWGRQAEPVAVGSGSKGKEPPAVPAAVPDVLRLHGSNTVGASLAPALLDAFLKREGYGDIKLFAGAKPEESVIRATRADGGRAIAVELFAHGTSTAFVALRDGKADIGMASRPINNEELAATEALGDLRSAACEYVIALDGVAVIVNAANPVRSLSISQIKALFMGSIDNWSDVGGTAGSVKIYARDEKSGTTDTFKALVLGKDNLAAAASRYEDSAVLSDAVANDPSGIGYIGMPYVRSARALAVSDGNTTAFRPTRTTVATEDYPLSRRLYFYLPERSSILARKFVEFAAVSDEGQQIAERIGFVGQVIKRRDPKLDEEPAASRDVLPTEYVRLTQGAERLEFALRFRFGSATLDNLALQNVKRIAQRIESEAGRVSVMVFGFGDSRGSASATQQVSQERADAVATELRSWGPSAGTVRGFGAAAPLANNDTEAGRERNRRVEIWIRRLQ